MIYGWDRHKLAQFAKEGTVYTCTVPRYSVKSDVLQQVLLRSTSDVLLRPDGGTFTYVTNDDDLLKHAIGNGNVKVMKEHSIASAVSRTNAAGAFHAYNAFRCHQRKHPTTIKIDGVWYPTHNAKGECRICSGEVVERVQPDVPHWVEPETLRPYDGTVAGDYAADLRLVEMGPWFRAKQTAKFWVHARERYSPETRFMFSPSGIVFHDDELTAALDTLASDNPLTPMKTRSWRRSEDGSPIIPLDRQHCRSCYSSTFVAAGKYYPVPLNEDNRCRPCAITFRCSHCNSGIKVVTNRDPRVSPRCVACDDLAKAMETNPTVYRGWK